MASATTFSGYRKLLRSISVAFNSDLFALKAARKQLKTEFLKNNTVPTPGACYKSDSADPNYITKWPEVRQYCQISNIVRIEILS